MPTRRGTLTNLKVRGLALLANNPLKKHEPKITKILRRTSITQVMIVALGAIAFFLIAHLVISDEIGFSGDFSSQVLSRSIKPLIVAVDPKNPVTFDPLNRVVQNIKEIDSDHRIEEAFVIYEDFTILAALIKNHKSEFPLSGKLQLLSPAEQKLIGQPYADTDRLTGLTTGVREFDEADGSITKITPVVFGSGDRQKVKAYVLVRLNNETKGRALLFLLLGVASVLLATSINQWRAHRVTKILVQYTNVPAAERVLSGEMDKGPELIDAVVGHVDIKDFTKISNEYRLNPKLLFDKLNEVWSHVGWIMADFGIIIDKLIGDAILFRLRMPKGIDKEYFGRLVPVTCGLIQYAIAIHAYVMMTYHQDKHPLKTRMGLATGEVLQGAVGAPGVRMDFTMIGWVVNLAVRIETTCKVTGLLISDYLWGDAGGEEFLRGKKAEVDAKGFENQVSVYGVTGFALPNLCQSMVDYLLAHFKQGRVRRILKLSEVQHQEFLLDLEWWLKSKAEDELPLPIPDFKLEDMPPRTEELPKPSHNPWVRLVNWRKREKERLTAIVRTLTIIKTVK